MSEPRTPNRERYVFLVYCRRNGLAHVLGPAFSTSHDAEQEVTNLLSKGWDATWVEIGPQSRWIVT